MKKAKALLMMALVASIVTISSCGTDEESLKNVVTIAGSSFSLDDATVYEYYNYTEDMVSDEFSDDTHNYLGYEIFDNSTYSGSSEISYYAWVELWYPINEELNDDEFEVKGSDDEWVWTASSRIAQFYVEYDLPNGSTYSSYMDPYKWVGLDYNAAEGTMLSVTETENGNILVSFSGKLEYWIHDGSWTWVDEDLKNAKIEVEGTLGSLPNFRLDKSRRDPSKK